MIYWNIDDVTINTIWLFSHSLFIAHGSMVVGEREILLEDFEGGITRF